MSMLIIVNLLIASWIFTYIQTYQLYTWYVYSFMYVTYTSIMLYFKKRKALCRDNARIPYRGKQTKLSALGTHWTSFSPDNICKFMNYQIKYAVFMDNILTYAKGSQTISHSPYLPRRIIINVWWVAKHTNLIYNVSLLYEGGLETHAYTLENAYIPDFAEGPGAHFFLFPPDFHTSSDLLSCSLDVSVNGADGTILSYF